jgi:hypothetical protein
MGGGLAVWRDLEQSAPELAGLGMAQLNATGASQPASAGGNVAFVPCRYTAAETHVSRHPAVVASPAG